MKALFGEKPLVLDREFSYLELMRNLVEEDIHFVIRLNLGSYPPGRPRTQLLPERFGPARSQVGRLTGIKGSLFARPK